MRVYLDNCCYNRPFDEGGGVRIELETRAKLHVQGMMRSGEMSVVNPVEFMIRRDSYGQD